jgi:hypothetical protein
VGHSIRVLPRSGNSSTAFQLLKWPLDAKSSLGMELRELRVQGCDDGIGVFGNDGQEGSGR